MDQRVIKATELLRGDIQREWSIQELAVTVNLSPSRLHQLFKEQTGVSPAKYLKTLRLEQARGLLQTSFLSIKEIRARAGIRDESHFMRDFRRAYGFTPSQYRARHFLEAQREEPRPTPESHAEADAREQTESVCDDGRQENAMKAVAGDESAGAKSPMFLDLAVEF